MNIEHEIKVIGIDPKSILEVLKRNKFLRQGSINFKRYVFDAPSREKNAWIRLRSDGKVVTLTYKKVIKDTIDGVEEYEVVVNDFEKTRDLLVASGIGIVSYQENTRELFTKEGVEVSIDTWPHIPPYLEIEAATSNTVKDTINELNLQGYKTTSLSTKEIYRIYGKNIDEYKELKF